MKLAVKPYTELGCNFRFFKIWYLNEADVSDPENRLRVFVTQLLWWVMRAEWRKG
jgi:hypothetical protein